MGVKKRKVLKLNPRALCRRIQSCQNTHSTIHEIVAHLRTKYKLIYGGLQLQPFTREVQQALHALGSSSKKPSLPVSHFRFDDHDDERASSPPSPSPSPLRLRKRPRTKDETEERLQRKEDLHIRRRQIHPHCNSESESETSSSSSSSSEEEEDDDDEDDGAVSPSEDAIYGQKLDSKSDLFNSMLRQCYDKVTLNPTIQNPSLN